MKKLKENGLIHILNNLYSALESHLDVPDGKLVELDWGCGKGGFSFALAERFPERHIFSADIMIGCMIKLDSRMRRKGLVNISLFQGGGQALCGAGAAGRIDRPPAYPLPRPLA